MATPRTSEKKSPTKKPTAGSADPTEALAAEVLQTLLHRGLVRLGEPARISEVARETGEEAVTPALARYVMASTPRRFAAVDRRWDVTSRYLDKSRPMERILEELIAIYGAPLPTSEAAGELGQVTGRARESFDEIAPRLLQGNPFFPVSGGLAYGLKSWLLDMTSEREDDLLFYNYLNADKLAPYAKAAKGLDWESDLVGSARTIVQASGKEPIDNRIVQYYAWKALGEDFDGAALYDAMSRERETFLALTDHRWLLTENIEALRRLWTTQAALAAEMVIEEPSAEAVTAVETLALPLEVTGEDAEEITQFFDGLEEIVRVPELLTQVFDIRPGSTTFADDTLTLTEYLRSKPSKFIWVGADRFRAPGTLPPYIGQIPESLTFPTLPRFETADGEVLDQLLADEGFEEALQQEILDPITQDVNDQEAPSRTLWAEDATAAATRLRLVLKNHHKEIGTFPLAQIPTGFFPTEPNIVELTLRDAAGTASAIYVDYDVQLVYGLFDVYSEIAAESGAIVYLEKTHKSDEYKFIVENETDPGVFVSPARMEELLDFRTEVESGSPISTYDIVRRILDHYGVKKGCSFLTLLTEVNLVRRTQRRLLASVLSGYTAFHPRADRWTFDAKKEPEGFDKSKAEFILKR